MMGQEEVEIMFERWKENSDLKLFPALSVQICVSIYYEMERCEPFQTKSLYDEDYHRYTFIAALYKEAHKLYPVTMERAKFVYFGR